MSKILIILFILYFSHIVKSQSFKIGETSDVVKYIIECTIRDHNRPDSYGNFQSSKASWDVLYYNGNIKEVIYCLQNVYITDYQQNVNFCYRYIMNMGKLACILKQYENISKVKLIEVLDGIYKERKINNLYFDTDYIHSSKIYLAENGLATIEWGNTDLNKTTLSLKNEIIKRRSSLNSNYLKKNSDSDLERTSGIGNNSELSGWKLIFKLKNIDSSNEIGKIVFMIEIDQEGKLVSIAPIEKTVSPTVVLFYQKQIIENWAIEKLKENINPPSLTKGRYTVFVRSN